MTANIPYDTLCSLAITDLELWFAEQNLQNSDAFNSIPDIDLEVNANSESSFIDIPTNSIIGNHASQDF